MCHTLADNAMADWLLVVNLIQVGHSKVETDQHHLWEQERGAFTLVLSGGSLFKALKPLIGLKDMDWSKWHVSFVDERHVPLSSGDSNFKGADDAFLSKTIIPREQVLTLRSELSVAEAAKEYEGQLLRLDTSILPRNDAGGRFFALFGGWLLLCCGGS